MRPCSASLPVALAALLLLAGGPARAGSRTCPSLAIHGDRAVVETWPGALAAVRDAFEPRTDVDPCADISLAHDGERVSVRVALPDGRTAERTIHAEADLLPTLEALLVEPAGPLPVLHVEAPPAVATPPGAPGAATLPADHGPRGRTGGGSGPLRIELSALAGARVGDGQTSLGGGLQSLLEWDHWLVGAQARGDRYEGLDRSIPWGALELALLAGRRFPRGDTAIDVTVGAAIATQGTNTVSTQEAPGGPVVTRSNSNTMARALAGVRLTVGAEDTLRAFVGLEGAAGATRDGSDERVGENPPLPLWTAGLTLGATVGTL